jgi:8-oxo-dGTP pyrophosphatase MutT (NUDIX family)
VRWLVHGERSLYDSDWVNLRLVDVEVPGGPRFEHHVVRTRPAAGVVVVSENRSSVLLLWRHRFITDTWGWEIPAGRVDDGESIEEAAAREVLEETGWRVSGALTPLGRYFPNNGVADTAFHLFVALGASHVGDPTDWSESERIEWVPVDRVRTAIFDGEVLDGMTLTGLCWAMAFGHLD